jgi:hypothetical protein
MKNGVNWRDVAKWNQIDPETYNVFSGSIWFHLATSRQFTPFFIAITAKVSPGKIQKL